MTDEVPTSIFAGGAIGAVASSGYTGTAVIPVGTLAGIGATGGLYTTRQYGCGCGAYGPGDVPNYCPVCDPVPVEADVTEVKVALAADITKARAVVAKFGLAILGLVAGWILAKIF